MKIFRDGELLVSGLYKYLVFNSKFYELYEVEYYQLSKLNECDRLNAFRDIYRGKDSRP